MKEYRLLFVIFGIFFFAIGGFIIFVGIMAKSSPAPMAYSSLSMGVMSFCMSYLYPQFKEKDERMKLIREKGMFFSLIAMMVYFILFLTGIQFEVISLTTLELLNILISLMICTVFLSFVVYSKIY